MYFFNNFHIFGCFFGKVYVDKSTPNGDNLNYWFSLTVYSYHLNASNKELSYDTKYRFLGESAKQQKGLFY